MLSGFSIAFWIGTCIFMLVCFFYTLRKSQVSSMGAV